MRRPLARCALAALLYAAPAAAQRAPAFRLDPSIDVPVMAVTAPLLGAWFLSRELGPSWCAARCDPSTVNAFDRPSAGAYRPEWRVVSDATVIAWGLGAATTLALVEGLPTSLHDTTVVLESVMVANALAVMTNFAVGRPRPFAYGDAAPEDLRLSGNAAMSFFSGHTANAFAATVATFQVLRRVTRPALAWAALGVCLGVSSFIGAARVLAGDHFPSDVIAGAVVGAAIGWVVPALHRAPVRPTPVAFQHGAALTLTGAF
ncbi:MAG: phosphatase PAP2 family protein [Polyangiales bacterium]